MKGKLTAEQQLSVLSRIWGHVSGYVFLPSISGSARNIQERRTNFREGKAYAWPSGRDEILAHLNVHTEDDLYFTPAVFSGKRRIEQNLAPERALWADLDEANPHTFDQNYRPTIAWETSPGRYQGVWLLDRPKTGASWAGQENHRLTMYLGADKSGWDSTQLLRVPGRPNHKFIYGDRAVPGELLWDNGPRYQWHQFDDLPQVGVVDQQVELVDDELLNSIDRHEVWARVKLKVSKLVREYMSAREVGNADRSDVLWQIERELADAGCNIAEIVAVVRPSIWNKFAGRADELKRLKIEAAKAVSERVDPLEQGDDIKRPEQPSWGNDWFHTPTPRTRWLVKDIWSEGACGFIAGAPKSYKSWMGLDLALSVATGLPFLGVWPVLGGGGPVLYLQEEDPVQLVKDRYRLILVGQDKRRHPNGSVTLETAGGHKSYGGDPKVDCTPLDSRLAARYEPAPSPVPVAQGGTQLVAHLTSHHLIYFLLAQPPVTHDLQLLSKPQAGGALFRTSVCRLGHPYIIAPLGDHRLPQLTVSILAPYVLIHSGHPQHESDIRRALALTVDHHFSPVFSAGIQCTVHPGM